MKEAIIGLVAAVAVAILNAIGSYILDRRKRKDKLEDDKMSGDKEVLTAIKSLSGEIKRVEQKVDTLSEQQRQDTVIQCRVRILRFADEITHGQHHSKDHFDQTMEDIDAYEKYCLTHAEFRNGITVASIRLIRKTFGERLTRNDWE
jgi:hypothetical protein